MIQRPRNRQGRKQQNNQNNKQPPVRGGGDSRKRSNGSSSHSLSLVPTVRQVISGAHVSIVLKIDQPTGHQVQGTVAEVLTSGDHPRGIKVKLVDGRVGRVQRMITEAEAKAGSSGLTNLDRNGEPSVTSHLAASSNQSCFRNSFIRQESGMNPTPVGFNLEQGAGNCGQDFGRTSSDSTTQICPVCYDFEGDEVAIAHHVDFHFA
ncbi:uncharacterized protein C8R40DRAFT_1159751 [Lentinula edodes]|uniref:uncharacterized protein n=1 Tax=Lentinula edodes TaxID=5353 RepID=UPI001E8D48B8|nr:uncharacterized protein C8R40DRAFT_1159751 [Lentinula edodes]KAH7877255.1 hypothetical protein C8R40DRAFT_1159751 [Lentinula edodes]